MKDQAYQRSAYHHCFSRQHIGPHDKLYKEFPYLRVELERTPNLGKAPVYQLILHRNGTAEYSGKRHIEPLGEFQGVFSVGDFGKLAYFIETLEIDAFKPKYTVAATDLASTILRIVRVDGSIKEIKDYGNSGPLSLWTLQKVIDSFRLTIEWNVVKAL
jgi:hypothetical protein